MKNNTPLVVLFVVLLGWLAAGCASVGEHTSGAMVTTETPPPPRIEALGIAPSPLYDWVPGYWVYREGHWDWVAGSWQPRPRPNAVWVAGHWDQAGNSWVWTPGRWQY